MEGRGGGGRGVGGEGRQIGSLHVTRLVVV